MDYTYSDYITICVVIRECIRQSCGTIIAPAIEKCKTFWPKPPCVICEQPTTPVFPPVWGGAVGGNSGGTESGGNSGSGGNGSTNPPLSCVSDPGYVVPKYPPPPNKAWLKPCNGPETVPIPQVPVFVDNINLHTLQQIKALFEPEGLYLTANEQAYLLDNGLTLSSLYWSLTESPENPLDMHLGYWGIQEMTSGNITWEQFENWFLGVPEYTGGVDEIDEELITFDEAVFQTSLPSLATFKSHFPKDTINGKFVQMESTDVYELVGGSPYTNHKAANNGNYRNACALRGSRGLLYSGIHIPVLRYGGTQRTEKGDDQKNYILDAVSLN